MYCELTIVGSEMNTDILPHEQAISFPGATVTPLGLEIDDSISMEQYNGIVGRLKFITSSATWMWGDILAFGERQYGRTYDEALKDSNLEYGTLINAKAVCGRIELPRRRGNLPYGHHQEIAMAFSDPAEQDNWLDKAETGGKNGGRMTQGELRAAIRQSKAEYTDEEQNPTQDRMYARAMEGAFALRDWLKTQQVESWPKFQRDAWLQSLQPIVEAYNLLVA
jgi:hypothetical protein